MTTPWSMQQLESVLIPVFRPIQVTSTEIYREIGIRSHGRGVFHKEPATGLTIGNKKVFGIEPGDFLLNIVFAWEGAVAIAGTSEIGTIASHRFPTFRAREDKLDPRFLLYFFGTQAGLDMLQRVSPGGAGRNRTLSRKALLRQHVSLPALPEQRRVVARIESLAAQINEARELRQKAADDANEIMAARERVLWPEESLRGAKTLENVTRFLARGRQSEQGSSEHFLIKTQHVQQARYLATLMRLAPHVASKVKENAIAQDKDILIACSAAGCLGRVARYRSDGRIASTDTHVAIARANPAQIDPDYLYAYLRGAQGQHQLRSRERGDWQREKVSFRLTELNMNDLRQVPVPVPSPSEQRRIVAELDALQTQVDALKRLQAETATELDALLPSILDKAFRGEL